MQEYNMCVVNYKNGKPIGLKRTFIYNYMKESPNDPTQNQIFESHERPIKHKSELVCFHPT